MIFRYEEYRRFLRYLKATAEISLFRDWKGGNAFMLRHDVDFDIFPAYKLAMIEQEEGVKSTYFVFVSSETYNVFEENNRRILKEMDNTGFEIGLHFNPAIYGASELEDCVKREAEMLSFAVGSEVRSVSIHNPSVHGKYPVFKDYVNAYSPEIFSDDRYISDSRMTFRDKDIYEFTKRVKNHPVQILLHPLHYSEDGGNYGDIIKAHLMRHMEKIDEKFRVISTYRGQIKEGLINYMKRNLFL